MGDMHNDNPIAKRQKSQFSEFESIQMSPGNLMSRRDRGHSNFIKSISQALGANPAGNNHPGTHRESIFGGIFGTRKSTENFPIGGMRGSFSLNDNSANVQNEKAT